MTERENQKDRNFNADEAQKQRDWQTSEWQRQYDQQRTEWYRQLAAQLEGQRQQFNYQAAYNSPQLQVSRLMAAGLNPSAMFNQSGGSGLVAAATGNISSAPSPAPPTGGPVSGAAASAGAGRSFGAPMFNLEALGELGTFARDIAEAAKTNKSMQLVLDNMAADLLGKQLTNDSIKIQNWISENTKDTKVKQAFADLQNTLVETSYRVKLGENVDADTLLKQAQTFLASAQKKLSEKQYEHLKLQVDTYMDSFAMQMKVARSQVSANNASAAYNSALTATEKQIREFKVNNAKLLNDFQTSENKIASNKATLSDLLLDHEYQTQLTELANRAIQAGLVTKEHEEALRRAQKENRWYEVRQLLFPITQQWMDYQKTMSSFGLGVSK